LITGGLVTLFCGMGGNESDAIQEVLKEIKKYDGVLETKDRPLVNPEIFKIVVERMLIDKNIRILYNSYAYGVIRHNKIIEKVFFRDNYTTFSIEPKVVIDCTGNGDIFYYCGEPFKEYYSKDIPIGLVVRIGGISKIAEDYLFSKEGEAFLKGLSIPEFEKTMMESILWTTVNYSGNKFISHSLQGLGCLYGISDVVAINKDGYTVKEYEDLDAILIHLRKKALELSVNLKGNKILKDSFLLDTAPLIGVRISRLLEGESTLIPKFTKNLLVAGRCISAGLPVMDRMRAIPACFVTGEMAGIATTLTIKERR